jgi:hypothetical protein
MARLGFLAMHLQDELSGTNLVPLVKFHRFLRHGRSFVDKGAVPASQVANPEVRRVDVEEAVMAGDGPVLGRGWKLNLTVRSSAQETLLALLEDVGNAFQVPALNS